MLAFFKLYFCIVKNARKAKRIKLIINQYLKYV